MPATRQALDVTEAYRSRLTKLTDGAQRQARVAWRDVSFDDLHGSYGRVQTQLERIVRTAQTEAVRLTAGYVGAFLSAELGEPADAAPILSVRYVGRSFGDLPLFQSLVSPLVVTLTAIKNGKPNPMGLGLQTLLVNVDLDVKHAARSSLMDAVQADPRIGGWQRAIRGTCGACAGAATGLEDGGTFDVHPNCQCVSEPVVERPVLDGEDARQHLDQTYKVPSPEAQEVVAKYARGWYGPINNDLRGTGMGMNPAKRDEVLSALDSAMQPAGRPLSTWRGIDTPKWADANTTEVDLAYGSTSLNEAAARQFATGDGWVLDVTIDPATKITWVPKAYADANVAEAEVLVERGARWVTTAKDEATRQVSVRILPPEAT